MHYTQFKTRFCDVILAGDEQGLQHLHLNTGEGKKGPLELPSEWQRNDNLSVFRSVQEQVLAYCDGHLQRFEVLLNPQGTDFQRKVWHRLETIPFGKLTTYGDMARQLGKPTAARAVGAANGRNPIPLIVPCHRVIGSQGQLTGFAHGLTIKQQLIDWESRR